MSSSAAAASRSRVESGGSAHARLTQNNQAECCVLRAACCVLRAACCVLRAACCVLRAAVPAWRPDYANTIEVKQTDRGAVAASRHPPERTRSTAV